MKAHGWFDKRFWMIPLLVISVLVSMIGSAVPVAAGNSVYKIGIVPSGSSPYLNPITIGGQVLLTKPLGQLDQYSVLISWGDGETTPITNAELDFKETSSGSDNWTANYTASHEYLNLASKYVTISAKIYHGRINGHDGTNLAESSIDVCIKYIITPSAGNNHGSISPSVPVQVDFGGEQTFIITPDDHYNAAVSVDGSPVSLTDGKYTFTNVTANHNINALFSTTIYTVSFEAGEHGHLSGTTSFPNILTGTTWAGAVTVPNAVADTGYKFDAWTPIFPSTVTASAVYTANFAKNGGGGGGGGGDGGGYYIPTGTIAEVVPEIDYFTVDFQGRITRVPVSSEGAIQNSIYAPSPDGAHLFTMPQGTITLDKVGNIIKLITIRDTQMPSLNETQVSLGLAYDFEPSGVTFSQPVVITLGYDLNQVPNKIESINLAYYSESGWIGLAGLPGTIAEAGKVSAPVQHFSTYAVIAKKLPASFRASNLVIKPSENTYWQGLPFIIVKGDKAEISVEVLNNGGVNGDYTGVLKLNDKAFSQQVITLIPDQNGKLIFNATDLKSGNYRVEIGGLTGTLSSTLWINWWLLSGLIIALAAVIWLITFFAMKKKKVAVKK